MKKIMAFVAALMAVAALITSCDSTADDIKVERITSVYKGTVVVGLYVPDLDMERENWWINEDGYAGICADTVDADVMLDFSTDNKVSIGVDRISGLHFDIPFFEDGFFYGNYNVRSAFANGYLAQVLNAVLYHYDMEEITEEELDGLVNLIDTLKDEMTFSKMHTNSLPTIERGAMVSTYDFEQHSFYARFQLDDMEYIRVNYSVNCVFKALDYVRNLFQSKGIEDEEFDMCDAQIRAALKESGVITDGCGWTTMAYSNYRVSLDMHVEKASGLLDVLSLALIGPMTDEKGKIKLDKDNRPVPYPLWLVVQYAGGIDNAQGNWTIHK